MDLKMHWVYKETVFQNRTKEEYLTLIYEDTFCTLPVFTYLNHITKERHFIALKRSNLPVPMKSTSYVFPPGVLT